MLITYAQARGDPSRAFDQEGDWVSAGRADADEVMSRCLHAC